MNWTFTPHSPLPRAPVQRRGFEIVPFGPLFRLVWANGAIAIAEQARAYWGERYAVIADPKSLRVIDRERSDVTQIRGLDPGSLVVVDGVVCVEVEGGVMWIPCADLARCTAEDSGREEVIVDDGYPERMPEASVEAKVAWVLADDAIVNVATTPIPTQIRLPHAEYGLTKGLHFTFADKLWPGRYAQIAIPGREPQQWFAIASRRRTITISWKREAARDPAAGSTTSIVDARADALLADRPDDLDARAILIDLLGDAGQACAETFALLAAGKRVDSARRLEALGPLAHVVDDVEFRGGLPWSAVLANVPPNDPVVIRAAARDVRLALLETFRLGRGPESVYRTLLEARVLIGLRRVDVGSVAALRALRATGYTRLAELWDVPSGKVALELLRDPAFASVQRIQFHIESRDTTRLPALVAQLAGIPATDVTFVTPQVYIPHLIRAFAPRFADLGVVSLAIYARPNAHLTITRGVVTAGDYAAPEHVALLQALLAA